MNTITSLYNLTLFLVGCCVITIVTTVCYIIEIIKYTKKEMLLTEKIEKIKIDNIINKENI
ncbi:hypothetical protein [Clostridium saccharobutylicum]|uniref:Uncharacterized protein n=1 Tax=Clostridium saccharobutylicum TaxID=169679 RepID=A0A1S8NBU2_CLOSA|nr:hypothetical protein [Clostridium saccharobutylicum]OOM13964.1 hypothetical protein CLOSAC_20500 [Clostridium saccharobutylicum]